MVYQRKKRSSLKELSTRKAARSREPPTKKRGRKSTLLNCSHKKYFRKKMLEAKMKEMPKIVDQFKKVPFKPSHEMLSGSLFKHLFLG